MIKAERRHTTESYVDLRRRGNHKGRYSDGECRERKVLQDGTLLSAGN